MLKISSELSLPLDSVTQTFAILAQRRKGKTYTACVTAEEMEAAGIPWVAIDPTGAWWGLRSSADGKKPGLPVIVLGGDHGDLPLERTSGKMVADLVIDNPGWYVLDMSAFTSKEAERQFATDFAEAFYRGKGRNKAPMHLFVDEADMFAPQQSPSGDKRMLGAFEAIVRRGGIRGIGTTLITQRAAVLNKNVLEQIDTLITLRTVGPNDRKAIAGYVDANGTPEQQQELLGSIASLGLGEAWVWSPGEDLFQRVQIRKRHTFNSSATPKTGDLPFEKISLAKVDIDKIREQMAATVEQAENNDPKVLREQISALKKQLVDQKPQVQIQQVEVVPHEVRSMLQMLRMDYNNLGEHIDELEKRMDVYKTGDPYREVGGMIGESIKEAQSLPATEFYDNKIPKPVTYTSEGGPFDHKPLSKAARKILGVIAQFPAGRTKIQISILSGYSKKSSSFSNALGELRAAEAISTAGVEPITATNYGREIAQYEPVPTGAALIEYWMGKLSKAEQGMLRALVSSYPATLNYDQLQDMTGYSRTSSSFSNAIGKLRSLELVTRSNPVQASAELFQEAK